MTERLAQIRYEDIAPQARPLADDMQALYASCAGVGPGRGRLRLVIC